MSEFEQATATATGSEPAASNGEIALRALVTAGRFLEAARVEIPNIARQLREGSLPEAMGGLGNLLEGLGSIARLTVDMEQVVGPASRLRERVDLGDLTVNLKEIVRGQEEQDWHRVADVVEHRIAPRLAAWQEAFSAELEALRQRAPGA